MMKYSREEHTNNEPMPEIETIGYTCEPSEEPIIHPYSHISRVYQGKYSNRPDSWHKWESIGAHRVGICEIWSSSDDVEIAKYRNY
jgi:hypothetical protein